MRKGVVIALAGLGLLSIVLMITVAWNGTQLDQARQERDDFQFEVDDLRQEVDTLTVERDDLQNRVDENLKSIEQLKAELGRPKDAAGSTSVAPAAPSSTTP